MFSLHKFMEKSPVFVKVRRNIFSPYGAISMENLRQDKVIFYSVDLLSPIFSVCFITPPWQHSGNVYFLH